MEYHLEILVNDEFDASNLRGIFSINGSNAIIDEIVSPFTKNYFTISDSEWWNFINYLDKNYNVQKIREDKLNLIFKDDSDLDLPTSNIIRKLKFIDDNEPEYRNNFLSKILSYYKKYGKLSKRQIEKCFELI